MHNDDDTIPFIDERRFRRGRSGYRADPDRGVDWIVVWGCLCVGLFVGGMGVLLLWWLGLGR